MPPPRTSQSRKICRTMLPLAPRFRGRRQRTSCRSTAQLPTNLELPDRRVRHPRRRNLRGRRFGRSSRAAIAAGQEHRRNAAVKRAGATIFSCLPRLPRQRVIRASTNRMSGLSSTRRRSRAIVSQRKIRWFPARRSKRNNLRTVAKPGQSPQATLPRTRRTLMPIRKMCLKFLPF